MTTSRIYTTTTLSHETRPLIVTTISTSTPYPITIAIPILVMIIISLFPLNALAHSGDEIEAGYGTIPSIDGVIEEGEWNDSAYVTVTVEGSDVEIYYKHDRENLYIGFDIHQGHNTVFPDTRVYMDTYHDGADTPQGDDFQLYINPDNGDLQERQGDGDQWQQVDIVNWTGALHEDGNDHWSTEYEIQPGKLGNLTAGNNASWIFGMAFLVYGNLPGSDSYWPEDADGDDPSTWANIGFKDWIDETDVGNGGNGTQGNGNETNPDGNNTDPNATDGSNEDTLNGTGDDSDDEFIPGFTAILTVPVTVGVSTGVAVFRKDWNEKKRKKGEIS